MKKLFILSFILCSLSSFSQTMTLINNTSELIEITQLWTNDYCTYNFNTSTFPQLDMASDPLTNKWIPPATGLVVRDLLANGPSLHDFEYLQLNIIQITPWTTVSSGILLGSDPNLYQGPASCVPGGPMPPFSGPWGPPPSIFPLLPSIIQLIRPDLGWPPAPNTVNIGGSNGKIYRLTWTTIWNSTVDKYDVEVTIN